MSLQSLQEARAQIDEAQATLSKTAKTTINNAVIDLLEFPDIHFVAWAARSSEYNDEGMYEGVVGPHIHIEGFDPEAGVDSLDWDDRWELLEYGSESKDPRTTNLKLILEAVGEEILCDLFGDQALVFAYATGPGRVSYTSEYVGT